MKKLVINKKLVEEQPIAHLAKYQEKWCKPSFMSWDQPAGHTEYHLYAYLSHLVNNTSILDIGTLFGGSALALSDNHNNSVISYDLMSIETHIPGNFEKENIVLEVRNFMEDDLDYSNVDFILIDVDPHDGKQEPPMIQFLVDKGFEGLILLDDILLPGITPMWNSLEYEKYNVTEIGHYSGTGILNIGKKFELEFIKGD